MSMRTMADDPFVQLLLEANEALTLRLGKLAYRDSCCPGDNLGYVLSTHFGHGSASLLGFLEFTAERGYAVPEPRSLLEVFIRNRLILLALHAPQLVLQRLCVLGLGLRTEPDPGSRLIHEVYGLVGQEAACDVAVRKLGSRDDGFLPYLHPVVRLVAVLETPQDVYGVLDCGLADKHRLEAPLEGCVLLYILAVLVDGGRANNMQLTTGESWFEHV